jgi:asparagine synthase (glutamine-hydrolysing)
MPGVLGIASKVPLPDLPEVYRNLAAPMDRGGRLRSESRVDPTGRWALGRFHLGVLQPDPQLRPENGLQVVVHGDIHNAAELWSAVEKTEAAPAAGGRSDATLIAALYRHSGAAFASRLKGAFCAVVLDEAAGKIILVNDALATYPLYWQNNASGFSFASELKSLLKLRGGGQRTIDRHAVADLLHFGLAFGEKTLAEGVKLVPAGSTVTYDWLQGQVSVDRYRAPAESFRPTSRDYREFVELLITEFRGAVGRSLAGEHRRGVSLSGGLDSRAILSAIDCAAMPISTFTLGVRGCADEVIAEKLSKIAGTKHRFFALDASYLGDFIPNLRKLVSLTDGMYLSHGLTEMLAFRFIEDAGIEVLVRGHGGELLKSSLAWPFHTDEHIHTLRGREEFIPYFHERVNYITRDINLRELFTDPWYESLHGASRKSLEESLEGVDLSPPDLATYVYLQEHHRRFTVPSLELFRNIVEVRLPFVDLELLTVLFSAPSRWREGTDLHRAITGACSPALLKVRNSNTGAPGSAGPAIEKLLDKFNSLLKKLNFYGYRHYHNFQDWMQRTLIHAVETVLLGKQSLDRGMLQERTLRRLLEETKHGIRDHGYLFQILLILEFWQEENL